jgi:hypothetical protein
MDGGANIEWQLIDNSLHVHSIFPNHLSLQRFNDIQNSIVIDRRLDVDGHIKRCTRRATDKFVHGGRGA